MDNERRQSTSVLIVSMLFIFVFISGADQVHQQSLEKKSFVSEIVKSWFSVVSAGASTSACNSRNKFKTLITKAQTYFFPPNLDFRVSDKGSGGEKVKEAASKSLEKSKSTLEDSAKSAAEIAGKTIHKTKDKVKKTLSHTEL